MTAPAPIDIQALCDGVRRGDRSALGRAITLVESRNTSKRTQGEALLGELLPARSDTSRIGITGVPGVGKSTFIDALGTHLTGLGHRVAVLAVDPTSPVTGGSILGDKTRMTRLSQDANAFIRPSPSSGTLGGVAMRTRESMLVCEAAGYDIVLVETVGVGQSEVAVEQMVDFFLVLMLAGAGDELQGIKRGILEIADLIAVNKADGENQARAELARNEYASALHILRPKSEAWSPQALCVSALEGTGLTELWSQVLDHRKKLTTSGERDARRKDQQGKWMWQDVEESLHDRLRSDAAAHALSLELEPRVRDGEILASAAARQIIQTFLGRE
jgi:LAO/AO transport system kinase